MKQPLFARGQNPERDKRRSTLHPQRLRPDIISPTIQTVLWASDEEIGGLGIPLLAGKRRHNSGADHCKVMTRPTHMNCPTNNASCDLGFLYVSRLVFPNAAGSQVDEELWEEQLTPSYPCLFPRGAPYQHQGTQLGMPLAVEVLPELLRVGSTD